MGQMDRQKAVWKIGGFTGFVPVFLIFLNGFFGCGIPTKSPPRISPGAKSPKSLFTKLKTATQKGAHQSLYYCFSPGSRKILLFRLLRASLSEAGEEGKKQIEALMAEYGVKLPAGKVTPELLERFIRNELPGGQTGALLFQDLMSLPERRDGGSAPAGTLSGDLLQVVIEEDRAVLYFPAREASSARVGRLYAKKRDNRWFLFWY